MHPPASAAPATHPQHHAGFERALEERRQRIVDGARNPRAHLDAVHLEVRRAELVESATDDEIDTFRREPLDPLAGRNPDEVEFPAVPDLAVSHVDENHVLRAIEAGRDLVFKAGNRDAHELSPCAKGISNCDANPGNEGSMRGK
jgi:hypothetical protein